MSYQSGNTPDTDSVGGKISRVIRPKEKDLGEFSVRRVLPAEEQEAIGPFVFFDHFGPTEFPPGKGIQVRPHPHIGIATITYLFEGEIMHRDSLGFNQAILPGAVNLMTAGRGIVHSERAGSDLEQQAPLHGIQSWIALPDHLQEMEPSFMHYAADEIPCTSIEDVEIRLIMGEAFGLQSPVETYSDIVYLACWLPAGKKLSLPSDYQQLAAYVVSGSVQVEQQVLDEGAMFVSKEGANIEAIANQDTKLMVIGGTPLGERHVYWNFVSNSKLRIEKAKEDWKSGRFDMVEGDPEFIPLPD